MSGAAFPNIVIRASAGSGKTYQLSNRYLGLLLAGVAPDALLAVTFTRKAAGEIFDRILLRLAEAAASEKKRRELAAAVGRPSLTAEQVEALLHAALRNMHRLRISTLDSYFAQVAGALAWELGLPSGWSIAEPIENEALREEAIEAVIGAVELPELLNLLHLLSKGDRQRSVSQLIAATVAQLHDLYSQTAAAAWSKLPEPPRLTDDEVRSLLRTLKEQSWPDKKKVRDAAELDLIRAEQGDWKTFIQKGLANKVLLGAETYQSWKIPDEIRRLYEQLLVQARAELVGWVAKQTQGAWRLLERFDREYRTLQHRERRLQFGDITRAVALAADSSAGATAAYRLDGGVQHLLLDEFQDTSLDQWRALQPLVREVVSAADGSFFCVGDPKQAIYGWRGGLPEIFSALPGEIPRLVSQPLDRSFRSAPPVIEAVNQIFARLDAHPGLDDYADPIRAWQAHFPEHATERTELPGYVCLETSAAAGGPADDEEFDALDVSLNHLAPDDAEGDEPESGEEGGETLSKDQAHYRYVARRIRDLTAAAPGLSVGVLTRSNKTIGWWIALLRRLGVPASEEGGNPLADSSAVQVVLSLLQLADHPGDTAARFHLAHSPLAAALAAPPFRDDYAAERFAEGLRRRLLDDGYGPTVFSWAKLLAPHCDRRELSRLQQLVEQAYAWSSPLPLRTQGFIEHLLEARVGDPSAARVRVMTIHQAKGLQFGLVVLPELHGSLGGRPDPIVVGRPAPTAAIDTVCRYADKETRALLPADFQELFRKHKQQRVGELLCVLYVALTRAEHALHLVIPPSSPSEKRPPLRIDGLLRCALIGSQPVAPASLLWEHGDPAWYGKLPPSARPHAAPVPVEQSAPEATATISFAPPVAGPPRQRERRSPSSLEGGERVELAALFRSRPSESLDRGTLVHYWLEQITWIEGELPASAALVQQAEALRGELDLTAFDLPAEAQVLRSGLETAAVRKLLTQATYVPQGCLPTDGNKLATGGFQVRVQNERTFAVQHEGMLLSGAIDRLCLIERGGTLVAAEVIDFKTDDVPDRAAARKRAEFYRPQVTAYRHAVSQLYRLPLTAVSARLVFLRAGVVVDA